MRYAHVIARMPVCFWNLTWNPPHPPARRGCGWGRPTLVLNVRVALSCELSDTRKKKKPQLIYLAITQDQSGFKRLAEKAEVSSRRRSADHGQYPHQNDPGDQTRPLHTLIWCGGVWFLCNRVALIVIFSSSGNDHLNPHLNPKQVNSKAKNHAPPSYHTHLPL